MRFTVRVYQYGSSTRTNVPSVVQTAIIYRYSVYKCTNCYPDVPTVIQMYQLLSDVAVDVSSMVLPHDVRCAYDRPTKLDDRAPLRGSEQILLLTIHACTRETGTRWGRWASTGLRKWGWHVRKANMPHDQRLFDLVRHDNDQTRQFRRWRHLGACWSIPFDRLRAALAQLVAPKENCASRELPKLALCNCKFPGELRAAKALQYLAICLRRRVKNRGASNSCCP